jgi:hypothetical protein
MNKVTRISSAKTGVAELVVAGNPPGALASLDATMVEAVMAAAQRAYVDRQVQLPATRSFAAQVDAVLRAAQLDMEKGADQAAIREFLMLFAERRNLPVPSSFALNLDTATMARWPRDLFAKAAQMVWERFAEMRLPNPPDFLAFIADELAERREEIASLHTLQKRLETIARWGGAARPEDEATKDGTNRTSATRAG